MLFVSYSGFQVLLVCVIATLVLRLHLTFEHSIWKISRTKLMISLSFTMIMWLIWITCSILLFLDVTSKIVFYAMSLLGLIIFVVISVDAVRLFIRNLLALAGLKSSTRDITVNRKQQRLINVSAKYLALFLIALVSSIVCVLMTGVCRLYLDIHPGINWSIDGVANILCLYLQYTFAEKHYTRYCSRLDCCFRSKMENNVIRKSIDTDTETSPRSEVQMRSKMDSTEIVHDPSMSPSASPKSPSPSMTAQSEFSAT